MTLPLSRKDMSRISVPGRVAVSVPGVEVVAVHSGIGCVDPRSAQGPQALADAGLSHGLVELGLAPVWSDVSKAVRPVATDESLRLLGLRHTLRKVMEASEAAVRKGRRLLVVGGDQTQALGAWSGVAKATCHAGPIGLIWIDAHPDARTDGPLPVTHLSRMVLAHLLGRGQSDLQVGEGGPVFDPAHVCVLGVRDGEAGEYDVLSELGVRVISKSETARLGLGAALREAQTIATAGTCGFVVSLDLDVIDPTEAPGVNLPVPFGLSGRELESALHGIGRKRDFLGIEISEFNPPRDAQNQTCTLVRRLVRAAFSPDTSVAG
ncbi:MAG: arginase family protein [Hyphomicrobiaceae bacterium]